MAAAASFVVAITTHRSSSSPFLSLSFLTPPAPPLIGSFHRLGGAGSGRVLVGWPWRKPRNAVAVEFVGAFVDPWSPGADSQSLASQLFAASLLPYLGFLYHLTKSKTAPSLTLFGFYFLLAFVGATIPAGIYAKLHYGTSLSNVDWLHGGAESFLTITNLLIVLGLRKALRESKKKSKMGLKKEIQPSSK